MSEPSSTTPQFEFAITRIAAMAAGSPYDIAETVSGHGRFVGLPARIELSDDGRSAKLLAAIAYIAPDAAE